MGKAPFASRPLGGALVEREENAQEAKDDTKPGALGADRKTLWSAYLSKCTLIFMSKLHRYIFNKVNSTKLYPSKTSSESGIPRTAGGASHKPRMRFSAMFPCEFPTAKDTHEPTHAYTIHGHRPGAQEANPAVLAFINVHKPRASQRSSLL